MLNHPGVWQGVLAALRSDASVHGPRLTDQTSITQMAADAWQALAQLPQDTPVVLAGHSMGGYVAIEMLAQARRPVAAVALVSTNAAPEPAANRTARERLLTVHEDSGHMLPLERPAELAAQLQHLLQRST